MKTLIRNLLESSEAKAQRLAQVVAELLQENNLECQVTVHEVGSSQLLLPRFFKKYKIKIMADYFAAETIVNNSPFKRVITLKNAKWNFSMDRTMFYRCKANQSVKQVIKMAKQSHKSQERTSRLLKIPQNL